MAYTPNTLYMCHSTFLFEKDGVPGSVRAGQIVRAGHPIMDGREDMFSPLVVDFEMPPAEARKSLPKPSTNSNRR